MDDMTCARNNGVSIKPQEVKAADQVSESLTIAVALRV